MSCPPLLAQRILQWALPDELKAPVLGDLEEEYHQRISQLSLRQANSWYVGQSLKSAGYFIKQTKRGLIMLMLSLVCFAVVTLVAMILGGDIGMYINIPSLLVVVPPAVLFGLAATSKQDFSNGFAVLLQLKTELTTSEYKRASMALQVTGNTSMWMGFLFAIVGAVAMASNIEPEVFATVFGPATAVCLLTVLYAIAIKAVCYLGQSRLDYLAALDHD